MQTDRPRILLLHASAGAGHRRAAEALNAVFHSHSICAELIDSAHAVHHAFHRLYFRGGLGLITRLPRVYDWVYRLSDRACVDRVLRTGRDTLQRMGSRRLLQLIKEVDPDAILCTHFLPAELVASWKRRAQLHARAYAVITDFAAHHMWLHAGLDGYFVAHAGMARRLVCDGIARETIHVSGVPIAPVFQKRHHRAWLRSRLRLDAERVVVLVSGGGLGVGPIEALAREALKSQRDAQFVFITGVNARLRRRLERMALCDWQVLGFVSNMHEWLAVADVAIGKAGGVSAAEMLASELPLVVPPRMFGHEARNARYLQTRGAAHIGKSIADTLETALSITQDAARRLRMQAAARATARPHSAQHIVEQVLTEL